ncbi:FKBP-type peptidyl-prolyl cis-trans isomerase [Caulobacter sp. NIBR2454]|uniref:FKBP-type peptidyl-prolyl cis-trans isomerase n=1 Tax=Caulobacter sp. NIBR2454 TaxID=3015996 RepID=UPI0022B6E6C2|nr:FKBP-type peptidyl-prolyl cis-trans isomerase [Caulobacter sp. NIBR2454]
MSQIRRPIAALAAFGLATFSIAGLAQAAAAAQAPTAAPQLQGAVVLPALSYTVLKSGPAGGVRPTRRDTVTVNYELKLADGRIVDSSYARGEPATFPLDKLITAWQVIVPLMVPGDEWLVFAPSQFGYGAAGKGEIPGGATLFFKIHLVSVGGAQQAQ